ncbi:MAG: 6-carboxytetrahydropterin synthase [Planctomycetes bacterium]|nr:6-carboxytetrahydropterin synthase [Planctomycetota bacterium]
MERWSIVIAKEYLKFSCAHFLIFPDGSKERLHGHNYRVRCEIDGDLDGHGLVIDFKQVKPVIRQLCDELDEHWIVPAHHPELRIVHRDDGHTEVIYRQARYLAPSDEILVLPIANTSAEYFAAWIGRTLLARLRERFGHIHVRTLRVQVAETDGQDGVYISDGS